MMLIKDTEISKKEARSRKSHFPHFREMIWQKISTKPAKLAAMN
jgi:hypothetical protein